MNSNFQRDSSKEEDKSPENIEIQQKSNSNLLVFGKNASCQLGLGHTDRLTSLQPLAFDLPAAHRIQQVFCGYDHTFVLTSSDEVFGFGRNGKGQLGLGNTDDQRSPQRVHLLCGMSVSKMAAGIDHSLALTKDGEVYSFGGNSNGQLGLGHTTPKEQTPQRVPSLCGLGATDLACGKNHTVVMCQDDQLLAFGDNRFGQLGIGGLDDALMVVASTPQKVRALSGKGLKQVSCGYNFTLVIANRQQPSVSEIDSTSTSKPRRKNGGQLFSFGENSYGQLGLGHTEHTYAPYAVRLGGPQKSAGCMWAGCGKEHALVLADDDDLYSFGSNLAGQLGLGITTHCQTTPTRVVGMGGMQIQAAACGKYTGFAYTSSHSLYAWGENTQGELGLFSPQDRTPRRSSNSLASRSESPTGLEPTGTGGERPKMQIGSPRLVPALSLPGYGIAVKGSAGFVGVGIGAFDHRPHCPLRDQLVEDIGGLLQDCDRPHALSDVVFEVVEDSALKGPRLCFYLHRAVLQARCPRLAAMAPANSLEAQTVELDKTITAQPFARFINYIYTGDIRIQSTSNFTNPHDDGEKDGPSLLFALMTIAKNFNLLRLVALCEKRIEAAINIENIAQMLCLSANGGFKYLQRQCLLFALVHYPTITHPSRTLQLVEALQPHPEMLASVLQLGNNFREGKPAECIEALPSDPTPLEEESFQEDFSTFFQEQVKTKNEDDEGTPVGNNSLFKIKLGQDGPTIFSHRAILAARSGFFSGMLSSCSGMSESTDGVFTLSLQPPPSLSSFMAFMFFIYTGISTSIEPAEALEILLMIDGETGSGGYFQLRSNDHLRLVCQTAISENVTPTNVWQLLERAHAIGDQNAKADATSFILSHFSEATDDNAIRYLQSHSHLAVDLLDQLSKQCQVFHDTYVSTTSTKEDLSK